MVLSVRKSLSRLTKLELQKFAKKYGIRVSTSDTKTGMISWIMISSSYLGITADTLRKDADCVLNKRK